MTQPHDQEEFQTLFPYRLHQVLSEAEKEGLEHIVSWLPCGTLFKVHDINAFECQLMPRIGRFKLYKSFLRQLNLYKFQRITSGPFKGANRHLYFRRNHIDLCRGVIRGEILYPRKDEDNQQKKNQSLLLMKRSSSAVRHTTSRKEEAAMATKQKRNDANGTPPSIPVSSRPNTLTRKIYSRSSSSDQTKNHQQQPAISAFIRPNHHYDKNIQAKNNADRFIKTSITTTNATYFFDDQQKLTTSSNPIQVPPDSFSQFEAITPKKLDYSESNNKEQDGFFSLAPLDASQEEEQEDTLLLRLTSHGRSCDNETNTTNNNDNSLIKRNFFPFTFDNTDLSSDTIMPSYFPQDPNFCFEPTGTFFTPTTPKYPCRNCISNSNNTLMPIGEPSINGGFFALAKDVQKEELIPVTTSCIGNNIAYIDILEEIISTFR